MGGLPQGGLNATRTFFRNTTPLWWLGLRALLGLSLLTITESAGLSFIIRLTIVSSILFACSWLAGALFPENPHQEAHAHFPNDANTPDRERPQ